MIPENRSAAFETGAAGGKFWACGPRERPSAQPKSRIPPDKQQVSIGVLARVSSMDYLPPKLPRS